MEVSRRKLTMELTFEGESATLDSRSSANSHARVAASVLGGEGFAVKINGEAIN
jgi:hypothetical protein